MVMESPRGGGECPQHGEGESLCVVESVLRVVEFLFVVESVLLVV